MLHLRINITDRQSSRTYHSLREYLMILGHRDDQVVDDFQKRTTEQFFFPLKEAWKVIAILRENLSFLYAPRKINKTKLLRCG